MLPTIDCISAICPLQILPTVVFFSAVVSMLPTIDCISAICPLQILPTVVFFSAVVSVLYNVGAMQAVIKAIALVLQMALRTTPIESFATAAHIFIGQVLYNIDGTVLCYLYNFILFPL